MEREPEPLERVRALVCEPCWANCFDTDEFEKLGRGDSHGFKYNVSVARGHHAMTSMMKGFCGLRLRKLPRKPNKYNAG